MLCFIIIHGQDTSIVVLNNAMVERCSFHTYIAFSIAGLRNVINPGSAATGCLSPSMTMSIGVDKQSSVMLKRWVAGCFGHFHSDTQILSTISPKFHFSHVKLSPQVLGSDCEGADLASQAGTFAARFGVGGGNHGRVLEFTRPSFLFLRGNRDLRNNGHCADGRVKAV